MLATEPLKVKIAPAALLAIRQMVSGSFVSATGDGDGQMITEFCRGVTRPTFLSVFSVEVCLAVVSIMLAAKAIPYTRRVVLRSCWGLASRRKRRNSRPCHLQQFRRQFEG